MMDWKYFFDRLGMNGTRWQWRIIKWERALTELRQGNASSDFVSVTKVLISVNLVLFAAMILQGLWAGLGLSVVMNPGGYLLLHTGAQYWPLVLAEGEWWRCITYAFAHGGLIHLAFNMVVLYQIGPMIEEEIGPLRFMSLYVLTALSATAAGFAWQIAYIKQWVPVVGASGSLFGLIGFAISYYHRLGGGMAHTYRNFMLRWAVIAFLFGLIVGADNAGHLGGALGGVLLGFVLPLGVRGRQSMRPFFNFLGTTCAGLTFLSICIMVGRWFF